MHDPLWKIISRPSDNLSFTKTPLVLRQPKHSPHYSSVETKRLKSSEKIHRV